MNWCEHGVGIGCSVCLHGVTPWPKKGKKRPFPRQEPKGYALKGELKQVPNHHRLVYERHGAPTRDNRGRRYR